MCIYDTHTLIPIVLSCQRFPLTPVGPADYLAHELNSQSFILFPLNRAY